MIDEMIAQVLSELHDELNESESVRIHGAAQP